MKKSLSLFVWTEFSPDHSGGLAFAIAADENEARKIVIAANYDIDPYEWGKLHVHELKTPVGYAVSGGS